MTDSGLYAIVLSLSRPKRVKVGKRGVSDFEKGTYIYIGSGRRNLSKRIARHKRSEKTFRWHIDYFRNHCRWVGALVYTDIVDECELAMRIEKAISGARHHKRFGASDCRCKGHLVFTGVTAEAAMRMIEYKI
ncbi:hypothetical protein MNBD_NITROSPINAE02-1997 [hydrothermal vent metagenome]|uniref:GIY-YIG domain-containing protein n=1 Tax=hydrothermal vent metagenome TaxID=652676 RepID=A0A3B1CIH8_9ZZZZ